MAAKTSTAVATKDENLPAPADLMNDLLDDAGAGSEGVTRDDQLMPFLRVVQSLSPERNRQKNEFIDGAEEGDIFNTVTRQLWKASKPDFSGLPIVPVYYQHRWVEWWPRNSSQGKGLVKDWGSDKEHALANTRPGDRNQPTTPSGTVIADSGDFVVFVLNLETGAFEPATLSLGSTQIRKAKQWIARLTGEKVQVQGKILTPPFWYRVWNLKTKPESNDKGSWFGVDMQPLETLSAFPFYAMVRASAKDFHAKLLSGEMKTGVDTGSYEQDTDGVRRGGGGNEGEDIPF